MKLCGNTGTQTRGCTSLKFSTCSPSVKLCFCFSVEILRPEIKFQGRSSTEKFFACTEDFPPKSKQSTKSEPSIGTWKFLTMDPMPTWFGPTPTTLTLGSCPTGIFRFLHTISNVFGLEPNADFVELFRNRILEKIVEN